MLFKTKNLKYSKYQSIPVSKCKLNKLNKNSINFSKIRKIIINRGLGNFAENKTVINSSINEFQLITGQKPNLIYAKKSIAGFKIRETMLIGLTSTLRTKRMYSFLDRLINLVLPQIPDFKGFPLTNFDLFGNYNFGIKDQSIFPEIDYENLNKQLGLNVTIVFVSKKKTININLLKAFDFPFL